jgi:hypothetical protein
MSIKAKLKTNSMEQIFLGTGSGTGAQEILCLSFFLIG